MSLGQSRNNANRLYRVWAGIVQRCNNPKHPRYKEYGGRGINLCKEWRNDYGTFEKWAYQNGYDDNAKRYNCTLDRIDNDKGYSPSNCRFVSNKEQCNNKRNNRNITIDGVTHTIQEWSRIYKIPDYVIRDRINKLHWDAIKAIATPRRVLNNGR